MCNNNGFYAYRYEVSTDPLFEDDDMWCLVQMVNNNTVASVEYLAGCAHESVDQLLRIKTAPNFNETSWTTELYPGTLNTDITDFRTDIDWRREWYREGNTWIVNMPFSSYAKNEEAYVRVGYTKEYVFENGFDSY